MSANDLLTAINPFHFLGLIFVLVGLFVAVIGAALYQRDQMDSSFIRGMIRTGLLIVVAAVVSAFFPLQFWGTVAALVCLYGAYMLLRALLIAIHVI